MTLAKVALVGCGRPAQRWHLPTLAELAKRGRLAFVAVCDLDEALAARVGREYGVPHYTDVEQMLERHKDVLAVDIVTGDPSHHALARLVAEHGRHVLVEKPMAVTLPCCDVIVAACRANGVHFEVAENYFRMPKQRLIAQLLRAGVLGDVVRVHFVEPKGRRFRPFNADAETKGLERPFSRFASYSGLLLDMGAHRFSQLRLYAQSAPRRIVAALRKYRPHPEFVHTDPPITYENPYADCAIDDWRIGHAEEIMSIANAALNGTPPEYGLEGRKDVEMCMAAYESSLRGMAPVDIPVDGMTSYERMLHDDYRHQFGRGIDET